MMIGGGHRRGEAPLTLALSRIGERGFYWADFLLRMLASSWEIASADYVSLAIPHVPSVHPWA